MSAKKTNRKKRTSKAGSTARKAQPSRKAETPSASKTVLNEIYGIITVFLGVFLVYSRNASDSGVIGNHLSQWSSFLFGTAGTVIFAVLLIAFGLYTVTRFRPFSDHLSAAALFVAFLNVLAMLSIGINETGYGAFSKQLMISLKSVPTKGGLLGVWLGGFYGNYLSVAGGYIFAVVMIIICLTVMFRRSLLGLRENRSQIREKDRQIKEQMKKEKLDRKLEEREEKIRTGSDTSLLSGLKGKILSNPYDEKEMTEEEKDRQELSAKWKREYEESQREKTQKEPVINTYAEEEPEVKKTGRSGKKNREEELSIDQMQAENEKQKEQIEEIKSALKKQEAGRKKENVPYKFPPVSLLKKSGSKGVREEKSIVTENIAKLEETLRTFNIGAHVSEVSIGPSVTRYEIELDPGIKVSKVVGLTDNIAMALAASGDIRMEAPIPGKSAIGIEVPNRSRAIVRFRDIVESREFKDSESKLSVALAKSITGKPVIMDIEKMPHVLIAGATGSGKSVCINSIVNSVLFNATPEEVRLILIDPKMVELTPYEGIPHLLVPVETNPLHAASALKWAEKKMEERYSMFAKNIVKDITGYNRKMEETGGEKLPHWLIVVDELADLMMQAKNMVEPSIVRLAQLARAAGIHLVIATQRPSVDVITGLIKANIPSRISFVLTSIVDSRTILDRAGAERLLGNGDMLYSPVGTNSPMRLQGAFISNSEVDSVVAYIKKNQSANYDEDAMNGIDTVAAEENLPSSPKNNVLDDEFDDDKFAEALNIAFELGEISTSMLQRRLRIGYARAGRIVDEMEQRGIVSAPDGSKPRKVLKKREDFFSDSFVVPDEVYPEGALDIEDEIY